MDENLELTQTQKQLLKQFYESGTSKILLNKNQRKEVWDNFIQNPQLEEFEEFKETIPALYTEIEKAIDQERNLQSAVFSECVYSQTLAETFGYVEFNYFHTNKKLTFTGSSFSHLNDLSVRYSYNSKDVQTDAIYQAGGNNGVDCAITSQIIDGPAFVEFKEPYARASDPNLPKYKDDGLIRSDVKFEKENPQFKWMLEEQINASTNIFDHLGSNINNFSPRSIEIALTENYQGQKFAHVVCTEDSEGNLVMIPSSHVALWAKMEGEIRPSGRNSCKAWSRSRLVGVLESLGAKIDKEKVSIPTNRLRPTIARGGNYVSRYRIDPIFFLREEDVTQKDELAIFQLTKVKQNIPSITAKMNFEKIEFEVVKDFYLKDL